jgi:hypothetical protein
MARTYFESRISRAALVLFVAFLSSRVSVAQSEQGAITGVILDETGAAVPKAKVSATNTSTQTVAKTESNDAGNYKIPYLLPGPYTITAEKPASARRASQISRFLSGSRRPSTSPYEPEPCKPR